MYNKLFGKVVDSSVWLEATPTRLLWLMMIGLMDKDGYVQMATVANLAARARLSVSQTSIALERLEGPDLQSSNPDHEGRRLERVPGGWIVLNAGHYRELATADRIRHQTRDRVRKHRANRTSNALVTHCNEKLTPSEAEAEAEAEAVRTSVAPTALRVRFDRFWRTYPKKVAKEDAWKWWQRHKPDEALTIEMIEAVEQQQRLPQWTKDGGQFIPHPKTWLNRGSWQDEVLDLDAAADAELERFRPKGA